MTDQKNTILAIVLSALVLIAWQYFFGMPQMEKQRKLAQEQQQTQQVPAPQDSPRQRRARHRPAGRQARRARRHSVPAASGRSPGPRSCHPRGGHCRHAARADRDGDIARLDQPQGRAHRRPRPDQVPHHRRSRTRRRSSCCRRPAARSPIYAEFGWLGAHRARSSRCRTRTRCGSRTAPARSASATR